MRPFLSSAALAAAALCAVPAMAQDGGRPDFSGVWALSSPPMTRLGQYADLDLTPEAEAKVQAYRALVDPLGESPGSYCLGAGMPEAMMGAGGYPMEVIQKADQVTIINELHTDIRRVFLGDSIAPDADIFPDRNGYSSGHWEGNTLVVETAHLKDQVDSRFPHSEATRIVERFSLGEDAEGGPRLRAEVTVTDPEWWTEPLSYTLTWAPSPVGRLMPYDCNEPRWLDHLDALAEDAATE